MKIKYKDWNPTAKTLQLIDVAEGIIDDYQAEGYVLTLRQLYYQFVARDIIENSERSYKNIGSILTKARLAGLISWEAIEDRNREHIGFWYDEDEHNALTDLPGFIRYDRWARQDVYVEVWVEKEALGNVISKACKPWLVPHMACKGYLSASEAWRAGQRFNDKIREGKECVLIHLGDHDPSGIDMTRDNAARLDMFTGDRWPGVQVIRVALNMDQVEEYQPPPNPAKLSDTRASGYIKQYGRSSWELDALEPSVIEALIDNEIKQRIDFDRWHDVADDERDKRELLGKVADNWENIKEIIT